MSTKVDFSFARPSIETLKSNGVTGLIRYLAPATNVGKFITQDELNSYRAAGFDLAFIWEWYAGRAKEGFASGVQDATSALAQANALGIPSDVPLFFAVDYDAPDSDQPALNAYFDGVASVIGLPRTGSYGGYWIIKRLFDAGKITYGYQTYAWSGGNWDPRAQLRQVLNGQWGGQVDFDDATTDNWGQWSSNVAPTPVPPPSPTPQPTGVTQYKIQAGDTFWALESENGWTHGTLINLNPGVNPNTLQIGQVINVPGNTPAPAPAPSGGHYTIQAGDTFWGLEARNGWAHGTLQGLNPGVNANALQIGQVINVPGGPVPAPVTPTPATYVIKSGDTFWALETAHGWAHGTLQSLNPGVNPNNLQIGETIRIPN